MNIDDQQRLVELALEAVALAGELGDVQRFGAVRVELGATLFCGARAARSAASRWRR